MLNQETRPWLNPSLKLKKLEGIKIPFSVRPTHLTFLLSPHCTEDDVAPQTAELIKESDVVISEGALWLPQTEDDINRISEGDQHIYRLQQEHHTRSMSPNSGFDTAFETAIFGSGKPFKFCDIPSTRNNAQLNVVKETKPRILAPLSHEGLLKGMKMYHQNRIQELYFKRDKNILRNLYPTIDAAVPATVRSVSAVCIYGSLHKTVPFVLRKALEQQGLTQVHSVKEVYHGQSSAPETDLYIEFLQGKPLSDKNLWRSMADSLYGPYDDAGTMREDYSIEQLSNMVLSKIETML